jgi:uncharacterized protein YndB with AHSA1/START domain
MTAGADDGGIPGIVTSTSDGFEIVLERRVEHDIPSVWAILTEPDQFAQWLAPGSLELRHGGAVRLDFGESGATIASTVRALEAERLLEYSWSSGDEPLRPLRWELVPDGSRTVVRLTLKLPEGEDPAKAAAGWDAHLEMLVAALEGVAIGFPFQRFKAARTHFQEMVNSA